MTENKTVLLIGLLIIAVLTCLVNIEPVDAQGMAGDLPSVRIDSSGNDVKLSGTANSVKLNPVSAINYTEVATTGAVFLTPLANRERLIVRMNLQDTTTSAYAYVSFGTATAAAGTTGVEVNYYNPLDIELGPGVAVSIHTGVAANKVVAIQTSRP